MPRDLFQFPVDPDHGVRRRRAGVLPVSVVVHLIVGGAAVLVPAFAIGALPDPRTPLSFLAQDVVLPVVPAAPTAGGGRPRSSAAPASAPSSLPPVDTEAPTIGSASHDTSVGDGWLDGAAEGVIGGFGDVIAELPPPPAPPRVVQVGGEIRPPVKIRDVAPVYPEIARRAGVQGVVIIEAVIDPTGRVSDARLLRSVPLLDEAALSAVRRWVFTPTRLNGEPTAVVMTVTVQFTLR